MNKKNQKLRSWRQHVDEFFTNDDLGNSIVECTALISDYERFSRDAKAQGKTFKELGNVAKLLPKHPEVESTMNV